MKLHRQKKKNSSLVLIQLNEIQLAVFGKVPKWGAEFYILRMKMTCLRVIIILGAKMENNSTHVI